MITQIRSFILLIVLVVLLPFGTAAAHNLNVFAMSNGDEITGYVYFTGGTRARQAKIELRLGNNADQVLYSGVADDQGSFALGVSHRADYTVFADTTDGHIAKFRLYTDDFAENLPQSGLPSDIVVREITSAQSFENTKPSTTVNVDSTGTKAGLTGLSRDELTTLINHAVARQVGPLREEVNAYRHDVRMSDIMGGIGVIIGIFGISAWIVARRKSER